MSSSPGWKSRLGVRRPDVGPRRAGWIPRVLMVLAMLPPAAGVAQQPPDPPPPDVPQPATAPDPAQAEQAQPPVFRSEINFVRVDAIVTDDDGNPVLDLTADDFEIVEDDVPQEIEAFEVVEITGLPDPALPPLAGIRNEYDEAREAARPDSRIFVFFLDDYHVRDYNAVRMTAPLVEFVETQLAPTDLVAVMYPLTPLFDVRLTRDHAQIVRALEAFEGRKYNYDPRNAYEQEYAYYPTTTVETIRNDVSLSALKALAIRLGGLREGRKSIIVLSEGYSNYVPPQLRDMGAASGGRLSPQRYDPRAGDSGAEQTAQFFESSATRMELMYVADIANKNNTSFYMVDPRGLAASEYDMSMPVIGRETDTRILSELQDTLRLLAEETDGRAIVNRNDVAPGLAQIVHDQSAYYLIGYTSSQAATDGQFHEITVRVKRSDVHVRARKGYYALTEENAERLLAARVDPPQAVETALAGLVELPRGRLVRTWVGTRRGEGGKTQVTFVWEPIGNQSRPGEAASQVTLMAMSDSGAYFRGPVRQRGNDAPRAEFAADPGLLELNVAIEDEYGDVLDRAVDEVTIPDFTGTDVALSTPAVLRAQNALQMGQLLADPEGLPTASRFFRQSDQLLVRVEAYAPGESRPVVAARLLNREGASMLDLPVEQPSSGGPYELTLGLSPFPRGDYLIEISASSGDEAATTLVAFRITG